MFSVQKRKALSISLAMLCSTTILSACGSSSGASSTPSTSPDKGFGSKTVMIDALGVLPVGAGQSGSYVVRVNNYSAEDYVIDSITANSATDLGKKSNLVEISGAMCGTLVGNGSCSIQINPKTTHSGDVILTVKMHDSKGVVKTLKQIIRLSDKVSGTRGISFVNDLSRIITPDGHYSIALPVVLNETYDDIKALNGSLVCDSNTYSKGNHCTYLLQGQALSDNTLVATKLVGLRKGVEVSSSSANSLVKISEEPNLIVTHNAHVLSANGDAAGAADVLIFNAGGSAVRPRVTVGGPLKIETNDCATELTNGHSCVVKVSAKSETSGAGVLSVKYDVAAGREEEVSTNVSYKGHTETGLEIDGNNVVDGNIGGFTNVFYGTTKIQSFVITNTGRNKLTGLTAGFTNNKNGLTIVRTAALPDEIVDCASSFDLNAGDRCVITLSYTAAAGQEALVTSELLIRGRFTTPSGAPGSYSTSWGITSSSIDPITGRIGASPIGDLAILSNGRPDPESATAPWLGDKKIERFTIYRTDIPEQSLDEVRLTEIDFNGTRVEGLDISMDDEDFDQGEVCKTDLPLIRPCKAAVVYGPVGQVQAPVETQVLIKHTVGDKELEHITPSFQVSARLGRAIIGTPTITAVPGDGLLNFGGTGLSIDPYKFTIPSDTASLTLNYKFTNTGDMEAKGLKFTSLKLPYGVKLLDDQCGFTHASGAGTLAVGAVCDVSFKVPSEHVTAGAEAFADETVGVGSISLPMSISYQETQDSPTRVITRVAEQHINYSRNWANVRFEAPIVTSDGDKWLIKINAIVNPVNGLEGDINLDIVHDDTKPNHSHFPGGISDSMRCTANPRSGTGSGCTLSFKVNKADITETGRYDVMVKASSDGLKPIYNLTTFDLESHNTKHNVRITTDGDQFSTSTNMKEIILTYTGDIHNGEAVKVAVMSDMMATAANGPSTLMGTPTMTVSGGTSLKAKSSRLAHTSVPPVITDTVSDIIALANQVFLVNNETLLNIKRQHSQSAGEIDAALFGFLTNGRPITNGVAKGFLDQVGIEGTTLQGNLNTNLVIIFGSVAAHAKAYCDNLLPASDTEYEAACTAADANFSNWTSVNKFLSHIAKKHTNANQRERIDASLTQISDLMRNVEDIAEPSLSISDANQLVVALGTTFREVSLNLDFVPVGGATVCAFTENNKTCTVTVKDFKAFEGNVRFTSVFLTRADDLMGISSPVVDQLNRNFIPRTKSVFNIRVIDDKGVVAATQRYQLVGN